MLDEVTVFAKHAVVVFATLCADGVREVANTFDVLLLDVCGDDYWCDYPY